MKSDKKQSNYLQAGYILRVCLITIAIGVGLLNSPSLSEVIATHEIVADTTILTLTSDSLATFAWVTEYSDSVAQLISFKLDGVEYAPIVEIGYYDVYSEYISTRFYTEVPFYYLELKYYCPATQNLLNWVTSGPAFGILVSIYPPTMIIWDIE